MPSRLTLPVCADRWMVRAPAADTRICAAAPPDPPRTFISFAGNVPVGMAEAMTSPVREAVAMLMMPDSRTRSPPSMRAAGAYWVTPFPAV